MANVKITDLPASTDPASTDVLPIVEVSADATKKVSIETLLKNASDGTESAPSFSFDGDGNTGIYHPAADQVAISTGGSQRILIEDSGVTIPGNFTVNGTTTTIDTTTLVVEDKNIEIGKFATPTDTTADGGGITLKGASDKTISWVESTGCWTFNQPMDFNNHVRIDSSGNVFIGGTTASNADIALNANGNITTVGDIATTKSFGKLQSGTAVLIGSGTNGADFFLNANANYASGWKYTIDGVAAGIYGNTDGLVFRQAAAGTAGDAVSWTEQARLTTDGNFLIGGSLPNTPKIALKSDGSITAVGNLGVGTTAPSANMHVSKSYSAPTNGHDGNLIAIFSNSSSANSYAGIGIGAGNNAGSFIHFGDTDDDNVGRLNYLHDSDAFTFVTAASERMRIDSGNVGIGTSSPAFPLDITGPGTANASTLRINDAASSADSRHIHLTRASNNAYIGIAGSASNDPLFISRTGGNSDFTIDSSGRLGIGTSSPQAELHINDASGLARVQLTGSASSADGFEFGQGVTGVTNAGFEIRDIDSNASRVVIGSSGNIGIGTSSPQRPLHVNGTGDVTIQITNGATGATATDGSSITVESPSPDLVIRNRESANIRLLTANTERLRVDSSGNVGIGTTSPSRLLDINNSTHATLGLTSGDAGQSSIFFADTDTNIGQISYLHSDNAMYFRVNDSERMRIDSSGNVGIGLTNPSSEFHVKGGGTVATFEGTGGNGFIALKDSDDSTTAFIGCDGGSLKFQTSGSSFSDKLVIDSSGNVGIGTTSPANPLHIKNDYPLIRLQSELSGHAGRSTFGMFQNLLSIDCDNDNTISNSAITFSTDGSERMRVDKSGNLMLNRSTVNNVGKFSFDFYGQTENGIVCKTTWSGSTASFAVFRNSSNNLCGNIVQTGATSINYSSASDYRLKENVVNLDGGINRFKQLAPKRFNFIADADTTVDGFLAHEAQTVVPEAVTGEKDGEEMQGIDQSKLVPLLTAALQEAIAKIETLETKVAALEAG